MSANDMGRLSDMESACERQLPRQLIHEDADISSNNKRNCNLSEYKCCVRGELMSVPRIVSKQEVVQKRCSRR